MTLVALPRPAAAHVDVGAERELLAAMFAHVDPGPSPEAFTSPARRDLARAMQALSEAGPWDGGDLSRALRGNDEALEELLALPVAPSSDPARLVAHVAGLARLRAVTEAFTDAAQRAARGDVAGAIERAQQAERAASAGAGARWRPLSQRVLDLGNVGSAILPTGFPALDTATRGGLRTGRMIVLCGAPGAGKTSLGVQLARGYAREGYPCAILACDEDADGITIRMGQQEGLDRGELERGVHATKRYLAELVEDLPLEIIDADESEVCIEDVVEHLQQTAKEVGKPGVLFVDSIQTARIRAHAVTPPSSTKERVEGVVRALKRAALAGLLVIATSEASRALYRGGADAAINPLAAGKESGAIEYAAALQLVLVSVAGEPDLVDVAVPKNRIGGGRDPFRLRLDRARARFEEVERVEAEEDDGARDAAVQAAAEAATRRDASAVARLLARGSLPTRDLYAAIPGIGAQKMTRAIFMLKAAGAIVTVKGPKRRIDSHLDGRHVPDEVLRLLAPADRAAVALARPAAEPLDLTTDEAEAAQ